MNTYEVEIIEPKAEKLLEDLANLNLIRVRPLEPKQRFKELLKNIRSTQNDAPNLEEITKEVEAVREERYARKSNNPNNSRHESLD